MKKLSTWLTLMFVGMLSLASCSDSEKDVNLDEPMRGVWKDITYLDDDWWRTLSFNSDGTVAVEEYEEGDTNSFTGTWSISDDKLTLKLYWDSEYPYPDVTRYTILERTTKNMILDEYGDKLHWTRIMP